MNKTIEELIKKNETNFSNVDKQIAKYVLVNQEKVCAMSINNLAEAAFVSTSSVLRFAQKLGFHGFSDFKYFLSWNENTKKVQENLNSKMIGNGVTQMIATLSEPTVTTTVQYFKSARRIFILATGLNQQYQARDLQQRFLQLGISMVLLPSNSGSILNKQIAESVTSDDLLIIFSSSGENSVVKDFLKLPTLIQTPIISFTNSLDSWLSTHSNCVYSLSHLQNSSQLEPYFSGFFHLLIDFLAVRFKSENSERVDK
ncbi:MurR/RpiR family transcriptional regulator [Pediococcus ethanolidurans]|nr:MurR/RpiR family transcriptional regulator [Pediococcus ethanolidurans]GEN94039.1 RpiR family transcriptional regulator [Pediococcus ethanolidurans]SER02848.1 transcriptional regulator, RpiR family [Pediococcus ethanolidurans]